MGIFENPKYREPIWFRIPGVMGFPQFSGYRWAHNRDHSSSDLGAVMRRDQILFSSILESSCRSGKPPVCSPDYFYLSPKGKRAELSTMFRRRRLLRGLEWNMAPSSKEESHEDWQLVGEYVAENVTMGEFLLDPQKMWDSKWFARLVVETKVGDNVPVRRDIVELVADLGLPIAFPRRRGMLFRRKWTTDDLAAIHEAAQKYWTDWRAAMESAVDTKQDS